MWEIFVTKHPDARFRHRRYKDVNPMSGAVKTRDLYAPNDPMRALHGKLIALVRSLPVDLSSVTAFRPGSSPLRNVAIHVTKGNRYYVVIDLHNAYESVPLEELSYLLWLSVRDKAGFGLSANELYRFISNYCGAREGGLATGAPASPDLFNFFAAIKLDEPLREYCRNRLLTYTRYCDDLVFSANEPIGVSKRRQIFALLAKAGMPVNYRKCKVYDLRQGPALVTGYQIYADGRVAVPKP